MAYCRKRIIRRESASQVYLLAKMQMNGAHAELFTYRLLCDTFRPLEHSGELEPLKVDYFESKDRYFEPGIQFDVRLSGRSVQFDVEWSGSHFTLYVHRDELKKLDELSAYLVEHMGLVEEETRLAKKVAEENVVDEVLALRDALKSIVK